ncbi:MAG: hypothetical protein ACOCYU_06290 [Brevefilum sp.]
MLKYFGRWLLLGFILFTACAPAEATPEVLEPELRFVPRITMFEEGKVHFELGLTNEASRDQPMVEAVNIQVTVTDGAGKIRNQMKIVDVGPIAANQAEFPLTYEAVYDPGKYVVSMTGEVLPSLTFPFEIREEDGVRRLAAPPEFINPHTEFTIDSPELDS